MKKAVLILIACAVVFVATRKIIRYYGQPAVNVAVQGPSLRKLDAIPPQPLVTSGFAPLAIGLTLTLIHLISIPVTNTSVNPARSTGPALLVGGWALAQLWLFWLAPILGGIVGGVAYRWLSAAAPVTAPDAVAASGAD